MVEKAAKRYRESHTLYKHLKDERYSNTGVDFAYDDTGFFVIGYSKNGRRAVEHIKRAIVKETLLVNSDVFHDNLLSVEDRRLGRQHTRFDMLGGMMLLDSSRMIDADLDVFSRADAADKNMDDCMRLAQVENMLSAAGLRMKRIHYDYAAYFPALKAKSRHEIVVYLEPQWRGPIAAGWYTVEEVQALASSCQKPILEAV